MSDLIDIKCSLDIDPIVSYKGRYNRDTYKRLVTYGSLYYYVDHSESFFDVMAKTVQQGDIIISYNDGITYIVLSVEKTECGLTKVIKYQPLFCEYNFRIGLLECIFLDGFENPFIK